MGTIKHYNSQNVDTDYVDTGCIMKKLLLLLILMSLVSAQESAESHIGYIETSDAVVELTDISGNKVRGTIIETYGTYIVLSVEGKGRTLIPRSSIKSIRFVEEFEVAVREGARIDEKEQSVIPQSDYNPCEDERYLSINKKQLDEMSEREYQYFLLKDEECSNYQKGIVKLSSTVKSDSTNSTHLVKPEKGSSSSFDTYSVIAEAKADANAEYGEVGSMFFIGSFASSWFFSPLLGGTAILILGPIMVNSSPVEVPTLRIKNLESQGFTDEQIGLYVSAYRSEGSTVRTAGAVKNSLVGILLAFATIYVTSGWGIGLG